MTEFRNDGVNLPRRKKVNLHPGTNVTITSADDEDNDELDITIATTSTLAASASDVTATAAELNALAGAGVSAAEAAVLGAVTSSAAELNLLDGVTATTAEINVVDNMKVPIVLAFPFTLDNRGGAGLRGEIFGIGAQSSPYNDAVYVFDSSAGTFSDVSAAAQNETTGDTAITDPFDTGDILYIGEGAKFRAVLIDIGTQGAGDAVASETVWEYYNGSAWTSLESGHFLVDSTTKLTATTGNKYVTFRPPSDWASTTINGANKFWLRLRATADDVYNTTNPVMDRIICFEVASAGDGPLAPITGTITQAVCQANTNSASNNDSVFIIINQTTGAYDTLTWTKADACDNVTGLSLAVTAGDKLLVQLLQEDGTTEFANGSITLYVTA